MRILIITQQGGALIKDTAILPRIGDNVDMFYQPYPKVVGVTLYPSHETQESLLSNLKSAVGTIDAIIVVE